MPRPSALVVFACVVLACGPNAPSGRLSNGSQAAAEADPAPPPRADGRLPPGIAPVRYRLELTIDPSAKGFFGRTRIAIQIERPTRAIVLHGRDLSIQTVAITSRSGKQWATARARRAAGSKSEAEELVLTVERELAPGAGEIDLQYQAAFADGLAGVYRVKEGGRDYAFTQFEPTDARRAFPCFDEPGFKVPFELSLTTPEELVAVANTRLVRRSVHHQSGLATHEFESSKPLPSYLVAFAVGELELVAGPSDPVPIRAVTAKGKGALSALAIETADEQLRLLTEWFDQPYPYEKLDLVAVPDFAAGAMENAGLVMFREELLLLDRVRASSGSRRALVGIMAHELAHQWFGNLVTLAWWDDLWLNEAFASWMGSKIVARHKPALGAELEALSAKARVMAIDALRSTRKVRQPVRSSSEALEAFDAITYTKGMSILGMVESWLGEDRFQNGVRSYVARHRHRTATAKDLFAALEESTGRRVSPVMDSFLDQTGVPLVTVELDCGGRRPGARGPAKLVLTQSEYRPLGVEPGPAKTWQFPVCARYRSDQTRRACVLVDGPRVELPLEGGRCPTMVFPNADDRGYYHFALPASELATLAAGGARFLQPAERIGLLGNAWALTRSGALGVDRYLALLRHFRNEPTRAVWERVTGSLDEIERALISEAERPAFERLVSELLGPTARRLGFMPRPSDGDDERLLRRELFDALGRLGNDAWVREQAATVALAWLADPDAVDADAAAVALPIHARSGDERLFEMLRVKLRVAKTPEQRRIAIAGLTALAEPSLVERVLGMLFEPELLKAQDVKYVLPALFARRAPREIAWAWLQKHFDPLQKRLPPFAFGRVAWLIATFCDDAKVQSAAQFLAPRLAKLEGADKPMRQALEAGKLCAAFARGQRRAWRQSQGATP
jgi:cytosol alanyl aminopeptidase